MRIWHALFLSLGLLLTPFVTVAQDAEEDMAPQPGLRQDAVPAVMARAVDAFIRPGYRDLAAATGEMTKSAQALCAAPSDATLDAAKQSFSALVRQWSIIEIVRVGPVIEGNRFERFLFFPDRKSTGLKQVQRILATLDETATSVESLKGKSVAAQGLGALEYTLYGTGAEDLKRQANGFRCRFAAAISGNLQAVAEGLSADWEEPDGVQAAWKSPGPQNPLYRDEKEAATELLGVMVHGIETVRDQRLRPFYAGIVKGKPDPGHPRLAIFWRSGNTMASLTGNYEGLLKLFTISDMQALLPERSRDVATNTTIVFKSVIEKAREITLPIDKAIADPNQRAKLNFLHQNTNDLLQRLNLDFGGAIGLGAGFSFADGD